MGGRTNTGLADLVIMVNDPSGKMGYEMAKAVAISCRLYPFALTGPEGESEKNVEGQQIRLFRPNQRNQFCEEVSRRGRPDIAIDYTLPSAVDANSQLYCDMKLPFIMGTSGATSPVNKPIIEARVREAGIVAVTGANMGLEIVGLQAVTGNAAAKRSNSLQGYKLGARESHQQGKLGTSQTAKDIIADFNRLGIPYSTEGVEVKTMEDIPFIIAQRKIAMIRDPKLQALLGVKNVKGHGYHTYELSPLEGVSPELIVPFSQELDKFFEESPLFEEYDRDIAYTGTASNGATLIDRTSPNGNIFFRLKYDSSGNLVLTHNIDGRSIYVDGSFKAAIHILDGRVQKGKVCSMIDVLSSLKKQHFI